MCNTYTNYILKTRKVQYINHNFLSLLALGNVRVQVTSEQNKFSKLAFSLHFKAMFFGKDFAVTVTSCIAGRDEIF